ncbi:MAG: hypothetical protein CTY38_01195 [Methylotenera sp.]|uniref:type II toxin-antitoxin system HipA family toxin n=1 Tax=Methylotenera sp. TaxID=2051956 RepID=UPI000D46F118|nr:type II toxin-antitoxin system HipA family toxin [Methylotenera sp.]PPC84692.1 MAG: hypothetical protein CTY38_01195 [Methylotenera sp.]
MKKNTVKVWLPNQVAPVIAGEFSWENGIGSFSYSTEYLSNPARYALDPVNLPLTRRPIKQTGLRGLFGVFRDAGPDYWGREVLKKMHGDLDEFDYVNLSGQDGVGAISISDIKHKPLSLSDVDALMNNVAQGSHLERLAWAEIGINQPTSLGGAKPKITVEHDNALWIAKFPEKHEAQFLCHNEHTTLRLAEQLGFDSSITKLHEFANGKFCLLVKRFDRTRISESGYAKTPFASANTVLGLTGDERHDANRKSYLYLADSMKRWVSKSESSEQVEELWNRLALSALIGNYDDHARNHGFLYNHEVDRWSLSPVFDVMAMPYRNNLALSMAFHEKGAVANMETLIGSAERFGIDQEAAKDRLLTYATHINDNWIPMAKAIDTPDDYIENIKSAFSNTLDAIDRLPLKVVSEVSGSLLRFK